MECSYSALRFSFAVCFRFYCSFLFIFYFIRNLQCLSQIKPRCVIVVWRERLITGFTRNRCSNEIFVSGFAVRVV